MLNRREAAARFPDPAAPDPAPEEDFLPRYLARIGYDGPLAIDFATLAALQAAHIAAIPFEAIDALVEGNVDIGADAVAAKLIGGGRGGYCFEQNGLLLRVLRAAGFDVEGRLGRVHWMRPADAPAGPRSHMVLRVMLGGRPWLVDAGFGSVVPPCPLALDDEAPQPTAHESYRLRRAGAEYLLEAEVAGEWVPVYGFDDVEPAPVDYEVSNWYTATHPASHFRHQLIAARTTPDARTMLRGNRLTIRRADGTSERRHLGADEIEAALGALFGIAVRPHWRAAIERAATEEVEG